MTDNSKIGDEFEHNKLSEVCSYIHYFVRVHSLELSLVSQIGIQTALKNILNLDFVDSNKIMKVRPNLKVNDYTNLFESKL